ncbi:MAG: hypothetical protein DRJ07_15585 [Bacteroidetes bacterium]|nr:MAG: hypothetical protein DRJ07_15585 [Bacteroidota bacterium]
MKKYILLIVVLAQTVIALANNLNDPLEDAKKVALGANKMILVDFYADWCGPCKKMDIESWNKEEVKEISSNYVFVKIDIDQYRSVAQSFGIKSIPYVFILDPNGEVVHKSLGYLSKSELMKMLKKYALNLKYLQTSYIINYKKETINSNIRLAKKQQEFSILLDKEIRRDILLLSRTYLSKAEKLLKKDKNPAYSQKVELLYLHGYLINGNYDKVSKKLKKGFKKDDITETNKSLYCFLNYMVFNHDMKNGEADQWLTELKEQKSNKTFLKEIKLLAAKD